MTDNVRKRWRNRVFRLALPAIIGENPLEIAMIAWAFFAGVNALTGVIPSVALQALPEVLRTSWAILMCVAAAMVVFSLVRHTETLISTGMYVFSCTLVAYSLAIIGMNGPRTGSVSALLLILGLVCFLRGWWLKEDEARLIRHTIRNARKGL